MSPENQREFWTYLHLLAFSLLHIFRRLLGSELDSILLSAFQKIKGVQMGVLEGQASEGSPERCSQKPGCLRSEEEAGKIAVSKGKHDTKWKVLLAGVASWPPVQFALWN